MILLATLLLATAAAPDPEIAAIKAVVETFRTAIIAKDKAALDRLPANPAISFLASIDAETLARARIKHPSAKRLDPGSYPEFVNFVTTATIPLEEKFSNLVIHSDGSVATVWFDYSFEENHKLSNSGHESWGLVHTDDGWKIASIVYSIAVPAPPAG